MKGTMDETAADTGTDNARRGIFRRGKRSSDAPATTPAPSVHSSSVARDAVSTVDDLARRIEELTAAAEPQRPVVPALDMQHAAIAHANETASTSGGQNAPTMTPETPVYETAHTPEEAPVTTTNDIEARLDAVLTPTPTPVVAPTVSPVAAFQPQEPMHEAAELRPTAVAPVQETAAPVAAPVEAQQTSTAFVSAAPTATSLGIDVERMVRLIEDEALATRQRIDLEVRSAHAQADAVLQSAEREADRIREHGQSQARVLLGEVEEIISEAQQTGEQILHRSNEEASTLRGEATAVLQQAQTEARSIVETARREGEQVLAEQRRLATVRAQEAMREQDRLKDQIRRLEERRRQVLESLEPLISQLTQMMPSGVDQNVVSLDRTQR